VKPHHSIIIEISADNEDPNEIQGRQLREALSALAQNKKEMEEANKTHARELAEVIEGWKNEINEALSAVLQAQSIVVSHSMAPCLD